MALETGTYIGDLIASNPGGTDIKSQGDDHIRLLKSVLRATFPNANGPLYFPTPVDAITEAATIVDMTDGGKIIPVDCSSAAITVTLPSTPSDGMQLTLIKTDYTLNAVTIAGNGKNINGLTEVLLKKGFQKAVLQYSNTLGYWIATIDLVIATGTFLRGGSNTAPDGYVLCNGSVSLGSSGSSATLKTPQALSLYLHLWNTYANSVAAVSSGRGSSAAADYAANKHILVPNVGGRAFFGIDGGGTILAGATTPGATGGADTVILEQEHLPDIELEGDTSEDGAHTHTVVGSSNNFNAEGGSGRQAPEAQTRTTSSAGDHEHAVWVDLNPDGQEALDIRPPFFATYVYMAL